MKIQGCRFLITGGNRGIGLAVSRMAAKHNAHLYITARDLSQETVNDLIHLGAASVSFLPCDLSNRESLEKLINDVKLLEIDFLFNNAGLLTGGLIEDQGTEEIYQMIEVNLSSLIQLTKAVIPGMLGRKHGKIINNASVSAYMHFPCASTYAASKAAVVAFTNCIEIELAGTGVSTLCLITPGIKTRMFDDIESKYSKHFETPKNSISPDEFAKQIEKAIIADQSILYPKGATGLALFFAHYFNPLFRKIIKLRFQRKKNLLDNKK